MDWSFWFNSILLGAGLAADAFSVSVANGLHDPLITHRKTIRIAGVFALFQFLMPMLGWFCVRTVVHIFSRLQVCIPFVALALLLFIGGKMIWEYAHKEDEVEPDAPCRLTWRSLTVQGIATSIDALSVGFTIETYGTGTALAACSVIGVVTFALCCLGVRLGRAFGARFRWADLLGGIILIAIGIEIFVKGVFL